MSRDFDSWSTAHTPEQLSEHDIAKPVIAGLLGRKQLTLLLGAGVSVGLGLPSWSELVAGCAKELGDSADFSAVGSAGDLMAAIGKLKRDHHVSQPDMIATVRSALYAGVASGDPARYSVDVTQNRLLTALGALMMSSARGSAGEVFTLNFDDVLEWYLDLHGFVSEVVYELPVTLSGAADVHVFHVHGFVPLVETRYSASSWMIFSKKELEERLAENPTFPWEILLMSRLQSKVFLIIGTSMADTDIKATMIRAGKSGVSRRLGFVLGVHDEDKVAELYEDNLIPVTFDSVEAIPDFLLEVCQLARHRGAGG